MVSAMTDNEDLIKDLQVAYRSPESEAGVVQITLFVFTIKVSL